MLHDMTTVLNFLQKPIFSPTSKLCLRVVTPLKLCLVIPLISVERVCACVCAYACARARACVSLYMCARVRVCMRVCEWVWVYVHAYT